jgi:apoptosis-inducing factor 3
MPPLTGACRSIADVIHPSTPFARTKLSKALVTDASKLQWRSPAELQSKYGVVLRTSTEVTSIDLENRAAVIGGSNERVTYESLILASGGTPRQLPIQGKELGNVFTLRGVDDAKKIDTSK